MIAFPMLELHPWKEVQSKQVISVHWDIEFCTDNCEFHPALQANWEYIGSLHHFLF